MNGKTGVLDEGPKKLLDKAGIEVANLLLNYRYIKMQKGRFEISTTVRARVSSMGM